MAAPFADPTNAYQSPSEASCPQCGYHIAAVSDNSTEAAEATRRIRDLEAQVRLLNTKAAAAVDKLADYEDEIRVLRDAYGQSQQQHGQGQAQGQEQAAVLTRPSLEGPGPAVPPTTPGQNPPQAQQQLQQQSRLANLSAFLPGRKRDRSSAGQPPLTPATGTFPQHTTLSPPKTPFFNIGGGSNHSEPTLSAPESTANLVTLQSSLEKERTLRLRAESNLSQTQTELEELTAQLFGQANEMVASERKARAKLEERVKVLEQRDVEKRKRLDKLEKQMQRIERVRGMVGD
ncbi:hypothetical protein A1O7_08669 [Cladophialophora yegresii CBS 114405]|uniref:GDP/GTP exchange factor Sec2 N-terminal domain-containing protein n=1 Tax=Cladophialophora yegresii CBS 114405 TaxID=1182544 RepID=W9WB10_9EURO|nr:uncharacterized protein A1O7_08669 [Cladophialophora yegresii CBS 114405]EXJ55739.1 hypothetical protein A1O7_08669 [Cladophialophora yegresii CBS 114405]